MRVALEAYDAIAIGKVQVENRRAVLVVGHRFGKLVTRTKARSEDARTDPAHTQVNRSE